MSNKEDESTSDVSLLTDTHIIRDSSMVTTTTSKFIGDDVFMKLLQDKGEATNGAPTPTGAYSDGHHIYKEL